jgi:GNAT superfamily N-acetyltransferase
VPKSRGRKKSPNRVRRQTRPTIAVAGSYPTSPRVTAPFQPVDLSAEISPGITARLVKAEELDRFNELLMLAGIEQDDYLSELLQADGLSAAVLAGAEHGPEAFRRELGRWMAPDPSAAGHAATLAMVAVTVDDEIVGAILAHPPWNVIQQYVEARPWASKQEGFQALLSGVMGVVKLKALGVDPNWRGQRIGAGLVNRFREIYLACEYFYLYGQFRRDTGLADFYTSHGFDILPVEQPLDLWVVFGVGGGIFPEPGEQIFYHHRVD